MRAFVTVAREGGLSRADQRLHLTQPAVSLQLQSLQERLGVRLFERTARGMRLTPDGAALLPLADRVLAPAGWGPQVHGKGWPELAALPWIETPPASAHHRLLARVLQPLGVRVRRVALVDQEASMLDLVRSGVGLSLVRDAVAIREAQARGLVVADRVSLPCELTFVSLAERAAEPVIAAAWSALGRVWGEPRLDAADREGG